MFWRYILVLVLFSGFVSGATWTDDNRFTQGSVSFFYDTNGFWNVTSANNSIFPIVAKNLSIPGFYYGDGSKLTNIVAPSDGFAPKWLIDLVYLFNSSGTLTFNESRLNATIDARSVAVDTNDTVTVNGLVSNLSSLELLQSIDNSTLAGLLDLKLNVSDQRYNDSVHTIDTFNTSAEMIAAVAGEHTIDTFNTTAEMIAAVAGEHTTDTFNTSAEMIAAIAGEHTTDTNLSGGGTMSGNLVMGENNISFVNVSLKQIASNPSVDGGTFGIMMTNPSNQELPHFILQSGGETQANVILRSLMIANEINDFHNTTGRTDCGDYMNEIGETLKIDCNTTTTGADLIVSDDLQVVGDLWIKDTDGSWHFLTRTLNELDRLFDDLVFNRLNITVSNTNFSFITKNTNSIIVNIDKTENILTTNTDSINLTAGTNSTPVRNIISYQNTGSPVLTKDSTAPIVEHAEIGDVLMGEAGNIYGAVFDSINNDEFVRRVYKWSETAGSLYVSGYSINGSVNNISIASGTMKSRLLDITNNNNLSITNNGFFWVLGNGTFMQSSVLDVFTQYSDGTPITNNKYYNVVYGVVPISDSDIRIMAIVQDYPSEKPEYDKLKDAEVDKENKVLLFPSNSFLKTIFVPVARVIYKKGTASNQLLSNGEYYFDIRGLTGINGGSPPSPSITIHSDLTNLDYVSSGHTGFVSTTNINTVNNSLQIEIALQLANNDTQAAQLLAQDECSEISGCVVGAIIEDTNFSTASAGGDLSGTYPSPSIVDDSHNHIFSNIDAFSEVNLYSILSDVSRFYEEGDLTNASWDLGSIPGSITTVEISNWTAHTVDTDTFNTTAEMIAAVAGEHTIDTFNTSAEMIAAVAGEHTTDTNFSNGGTINGALDVSGALSAESGAITQTTTTGNALSVTRNLASASTNNPVVQIKQDNAGDDQSALKIQQDGTNYGLNIDQNGDEAALYIDSASANRAPIVAYGTNTGGSGTSNRNPVIFAQQRGGGQAGYFYRNIASATTNDPVFEIIQDNSGDDQSALSIRQDNAGTPAVEIFAGSTSGVHMFLSPSSSAQATCTEGEIYYDDSGALCLCYTANTWENLGVHGTCS